MKPGRPARRRQPLRQPPAAVGVGARWMMIINIGRTARQRTVIVVVAAANAACLGPIEFMCSARRAESMSLPCSVARGRRGPSGLASSGAGAGAAPADRRLPVPECECVSLNAQAAGWRGSQAIIIIIIMLHAGGARDLHARRRRAPPTCGRLESRAHSARPAGHFSATAARVAV
jgi:hypothetical protein